MGAILRPIPISLLSDTLKYRLAEDGQYNGKYGEEHVIKHVRFQGLEKLNQSSYLLQGGSQGLIFIDAINSTGAVELPVGALVSVNGGEEYPVKKCTALKGYFGEVHHWEVEI